MKSPQFSLRSRLMFTFLLFGSIPFGVTAIWLMSAVDIEAGAPKELVSKIHGMIGLISVAVVVLGSAAAWYFAGQLTSGFTSTLGLLRGIADSTKENTEKVQSAADTSSKSVMSQASSIQETVATLDEIRSMVQKTAANSKQSEKKTKESRKMAAQGEKAVQEIVRAINEIKTSNDEITQASTESSQKVSNINDLIKGIAEKTKVINDIVFQTKLLSFNASVEAARAGEHGKGFAVVAEEVGNLAQMSGVAAKEINTMLEKSISTVNQVTDESRRKIGRIIESGSAKVDNGVVTSERCREVLTQVMKNVEAISTMMTEISKATQEQAEGVKNIAEAMSDIDRHTLQSSDTSKKTASYAENLVELSSQFSDTLNHWENQIHGGKSESFVPMTAAAGMTFDEGSESNEEEGAKILEFRPRQEVAEAPAAELKSASNGSDVPSYEDDRFEEI